MRGPEDLLPSKETEMTEPAGLASIVAIASVVDAVARLEKAVTAQGLKVFARLDHTAGAVAAGLDLRPTTLLLIGDPRGGTPWMQVCQEAGIDLPLRALAWEDEAGICRVTYSDPLWMAKARGLGPQAETMAGDLAGTLAAVAHADAA
jgi:uncharacterized protein (DUF302 family)